MQSYAATAAGLPEYVATHSHPTDYLAPLRTDTRAFALIPLGNVLCAQQAMIQALPMSLFPTHSPPCNHILSTPCVTIITHLPLSPRLTCHITLLPAFDQSRPSERYISTNQDKDHSRIKWAWEPGPLSPKIFFKSMQFSGNFEQSLGFGPPWGQNSTGPPDLLDPPMKVFQSFALISHISTGKQNPDL